MKQIYDNYTTEDQRVWKTLFERQMTILPDIASKAYLNGLQSVGFNAECIPNFEMLNERLKNLTGWSLHVVKSIIPEKEFFPLLQQKKFSATTWLRKMSELDYLEEPDMFHDLFGHVPLLSNQTFCDFFQGLSTIALNYLDNEKALKLLGRIYWFTVEFGLIHESDKLKIYGAGILSSHGETKYSLSGKPEYLAFSVSEILSTPYQNDRIQEKYFVIDSYEQLFNSLHEIELELAAIFQSV
jgi:phenylalanine-4-hydroxylase